MSCGIQKLLSEYDCDVAKIKLVDPTMTQLIKNYYKKDLVKVILDDIGLADAEWVLFVVSDHDKDLMDSARLGTSGSHFSLLVYSKKQNTSFDFDSVLFKCDKW